MLEKERTACEVYAGLCDELAAKGLKDLESALAVVMTIEDMDVQDLLDHIAEPDNDDVRTVYHPPEPAG